MAKSFRERVEHLLTLIREPLSEYGIQRLKARYDNDWRQAAFDHLGDRHHGHSGDDPREWDIQAWLNFYIAAWSSLFGEVLGPGERNYFFRLREVRNNWAHLGSFDFDTIYRAYDDAQLAMEAINSPIADTIAEQKEQIQREKFAQPSKKRIVKIKASPLTSLKPWREVAVPHEDVSNGTFSSSEFAADLWEVHKAVTGIPGARVSKEYGDPRTFFGRTYITTGLGNLIRATSRRLAGTGGEPVIQLQTNFGGGKTHSMLAVYHMTGDTPARDLPRLDEFLAAEKLSVPRNLRRAVIVGNKIPLSVIRKPDGTKVRTLWGEIAWQLGGKAGYDMVKTADEQATNPGDRFTDLLKRFAPAVVLIDEWVAYARQLYGRTDLAAGGSFDTQFTFAQTLTESAKIAQNVVIVVSLPESEQEVGGDAGLETLKRLRSVMGRVESTWQPATRDEAYEIVRSRLFSSDFDTRARSETVRAFQELYKNAPDHFPQAVREAEYVRRIEATYPIHPDLFDSLYRTWSTIPNFQQTRGVLRLMASIIHSLWINQDKGLMIMSSLVPLDDSIVSSEFTKFLHTGWSNIISSEIDGEGSLAFTIDKENSALGAVGATRRVARSLFLATSPLQTSHQRGIDVRALKVSCTQPGEKPAIFGDALDKLAAASVHLYQESARYWFSEQPTLRRLAEDRKSQLLGEPDVVYSEIELVMRSAPHAEKGDFARVHVAPRSPSDVGDHDEVALVILPPTVTHTRGSSDSVALDVAREIFESRGAAPRINKNMIVFGAADSGRMDELVDAVAGMLAWRKIVKQIEDRSPDMANVTRGQEESAKADLETMMRRVHAMIPETYRWMLLPTQTDPRQRPEIEEHQVSGTDPLAVRISRYLGKRQWLMPFMDGPALRIELDQIPLWDGDSLQVKKLLEYFARFTYLPRVGSRQTILEAIRSGIASLTWNPQTFAWARSIDEGNPDQRFVGLVAGEHVLEDIGSGYLVKPEVAQKQLDMERRASAVRDSDGTGVDTGSDTEQPIPENAVNATAGETPSSQQKKKRFFGTVSLNASSPSTQMGVILDEVISHLTASGADVRLTLDMDASLAEGFPERVRKIVEQNARDLKFDQAGFEDE